MNVKLFAPQIAASAYILPSETKTYSVSIPFYLPYTENCDDDLSCLINNTSFDFWKSEEENIY